MTRQAKKLDDTVDFLRSTLKAGPVQTKLLMSIASASGINEHTLEQAKKTCTRSFQKERAWFVEWHESVNQQPQFFPQPTIPSWLTPDEVIWWVENDPVLSINTTLRRVAEASDYLNESGIIIAHEDAILSAETAIEGLLQEHQKSPTQRIC